MSRNAFVDIRDKVSIVTGSSAGIGEAIALEFAKQGCHLTLCGRDEKRLQDVKKKCLDQDSSHKIKVETVCGDIVEPEVQKRIIGVTFKAFGKIDILVNNAGVAAFWNPENTDTKEFHRIMKTNVESVFFLTQLAIPYLKKTHGNIVNISSIASNKAMPKLAVYAMSKAALDSLTISLSLYLAPHKVRVNSVNPTSVATMIYRRGKDAWSDEKFEKYQIDQSSTDLHPLGRIAKVTDVADAVVFLASNRASFLTGQIVFVDGGRNILGPQQKL